MRRQLLWIILFFWIMTIGVLQAQLLPAVQGVIQDDAGNVLEAATVVLLTLPDSTIGMYSLTNNKGGYLLRTKRGSYALQVSYLGYQNLSIPLEIQRDTNIGILTLQEITDTLQLIEVTAEHIPVQMRGDTLSFNSAAFKVRSHDDAGALLRQLPGLSIQDDGSILFNGQKVTEVLVDGKMFFGEDAQATLRTLSADAIKKIDITDTEVSSKGIEPEDDQKTINLRLKKKAKTGTTGNLGIGYGAIVPPTNRHPTLQNFEDHRYHADASMTYFTPSTRSAIYGRSHNVPLANPFVMSSTLATGITRKNSIGATFNWVPSTATTWNNSYRFVQSRMVIEQESKEISRLPERDFERTREQEQGSVPMNHNVSSNFTHKFDKQHLIRIRLTASYQDNENGSNRLDRSMEDGFLQNELKQQYAQNQRFYLLVPNVAFEKRFEKKGRQLLLNIGTKWSDRPSTSQNDAETNFYDNTGNYTTDTLSQEQERQHQQQNYNGSALWKEPLTKKDKLYLTFKAGLERDQSSQATFDVGETSRQINPMLSDSFQRFYNYQAVLLSWRRKTKAYRLEVTGGMRRSLLQGITQTTKLHQELYLPTGKAQLRYTLSKGKKLIFNYNLYLVELTLGQLQPFVNNTDPLAIQLGNTDLQPAVNHRFSARLSWFEQSNFTNIYAKVQSLLTPNTILQMQTIDDDLKVTYKPTNSTLSSNVLVEVGYNRLFQALDIVFDISAEGNRGQRPFLLNGEEAQQQINYGYGLKVKLSNKKKKIIDWGMQANLNGGLFRYEKGQENLNEYFNQYYGGYIGVEFLKHWEAQTKFGLSLYAQSGERDDPTIALWSFGIKRRFWEDNRLEIELKAENLLNESVRVQQSQQAFFLTEQKTRGLGRYILLSFRYKFRKKE
ncbi:MAG: outer membrane beta-barrel protein [Aureispira sp.]